jgi:hypothetical protein
MPGDDTVYMQRQHKQEGIEMRYEVGHVWKEEPRWSSRIGQWKVQFPKGIGTFRTKREAMLWVDQMIKDGLFNGKEN